MEKYGEISLWAHKSTALNKLTNDSVTFPAKRKFTNND